MSVTGRITKWENGSEKSVFGALVIAAAPGSWLDTSKMYDVLWGSVVGKAVTKDNGTYILNVPPGNYEMILWKEHYIPATETMNIINNYDGSISPDTQVGWTGRHMRLEYRKNQ